MIEWIYELRAIAIMAVVVCHQQYLLHNSETVQLLTLFSVTVLIFLMGYTSSMSLKKHTDLLCEKGAFSFCISKLKSIIISYSIATVAYLTFIERTFSETKVDVVLESLLTFSATGPFYFIKFYIVFTFMGPFLFYIVKKISLLKSRYEVCLYIVFTFLCYLCGYLLIGKWNFLGGSYLAVYTGGMIWGYRERGIVHKKIYLMAGTVLFVFGLYSTRIFYWNRVDGIYEPSGIDRLVPKLAMNPPNLSICIYSVGVILLGRIVFEYFNKIAVKGIGKIFRRALLQIGCYSLDIFLWHIFIQQLLLKYVVIENIWLQRVVYYLAMFLIPIWMRKIYTIIKEDAYKVLKAEN